MERIKIFAKTIEQEALDQIKAMGDSVAYKDCDIRIMPDCHAGKGWCLSGFEPYPNEGYVDCGENETLFYFLAALRDDCDSNQLFVNGKGDWGVWRDEVLSGIEWSYLPKDTNINNYHKATKEEIIELFKDK